MARAFKKFLPMFDRVLVERFAAETKTKSGIIIPEKAQGKVLEATVVAVGGGARKDGEVVPVSVTVGDKVLLPEYGGTKVVIEDKGEVVPVSVTVGDKVLLPEYGGTKVVIEDKDYFLFRDSDILGKFES